MKIMNRILLLSLVVLVPQATAGVGHGDFSNLSFTEAFDSLYVNFSTCYPFTDWKALDWQGLYDEYSQKIEDAQNSNDASAFKLAIRRFIHSFLDGHVRVRGEFQDIFFGEIGGGFGLTLIELDDGSIVVNRVLSGSPAEQEGIEVGAVIIDWNCLSVNEALQNTNIFWEGKPPATREATRLAQIRRLIRMPVGARIEITFSNPRQNSVTKSLTTVDDGMETWDLTSNTKFNTNGSVSLTLDDIFNPIQYEILESGYGYLKNGILVEFDSQGNLLPTYDNIYNSIKEAIDNFSTTQVPGVIVDIRDNPGGFDRLAALFGSFFYDHTELYEHASFYNPEIGQFDIVESFTIYLEPQESYYGGPVICLVNAGTSSSARRRIPTDCRLDISQPGERPSVAPTSHINAAPGADATFLRLLGRAHRARWLVHIAFAGDSLQIGVFDSSKSRWVERTSQASRPGRAPWEATARQLRRIVMTRRTSQAPPSAAGGKRWYKRWWVWALVGAAAAAAIGISIGVAVSSDKASTGDRYDVGFF